MALNKSTGNDSLFLNNGNSNNIDKPKFLKSYIPKPSQF